MRDDAGRWIIDHLADAFIYPRVFDKAVKTGEPVLSTGEYNVAMFAQAPANQSVKKKPSDLHYSKKTFKSSDQNQEAIYQIASMSGTVETAGTGFQSHFLCNEPNPEYTQRRVNQDDPFTIPPKEIGMEQDSVALGRQDGESSEAWENSANQAIAGGIDGVFYLMQRLPGDAGVQQPVAL